MNYLSFFSGIGAFEKALRNIGVQYNLVGYCEIDKYASKSYSAIHNVSEEKNLGDITKIDAESLPKDIDLITYGFPCQDISLAGKQKGLFNEDGSQTRSGLFFEALRIIETTQPKVAIAENVKNLTSKKFKEQFEIVLNSLEEAGYNNYWKVLNAKDFGIPQNRERVFIVSIRKDIEKKFEFPQGFPLELRLKDMLEDTVEEKFYLSDKMFNYAFNIVKEAKGIGFSDSVDNSYINPLVANTIGCRSAEGQRSGTTNYVSNDFDEPLKVKEMKALAKDTEGKPTMQKWVSEKGVRYILSPKRGMCTDINAPISQPLTAKGQANWTGSFVSPDIDRIEKNTTIGATEPTRIYLKNGEVITSDDLDEMLKVETTKEVLDNNRIIREEPLEREGWHEYAKEVLSVEGLSRTLSTQSNNLATKIKEPSSLRIRKLTPKECFRLMGFDDEDFEKAAKVNSNTQLYKQAGNSIVVDVLEHLFDSLKDYFN